MTIEIERIAAAVDGFARLRVAVIGDLILDRYVGGHAQRISPEAPVPVLRVSREDAVLGGAANVMRNLRSLGVDVDAYGLVGDDTNAQALRSLCDDAGIGSAGVLTDPDRRTSVKTRVIAEHQQVVRLDDEDDHPLRPAMREELVAALAAAFESSSYDAVILSDYNKGVLSRDLAQSVCELARAQEALVALDPHPGNPLPVKGLSLVTPNRAEAFAMAGVLFNDCDDMVEEVGAAILDAWSPEHLLMTLGPDGMALFRPDQDTVRVGTVAREVYDVSGAGDTVIAVAVLGMLSSIPATEAVILANHAAGVVVAKLGTAVIEKDELIANFS